MSDAKEIPILDIVVELGVMRMRVGVAEAGASYMPRFCMWVDHRSGMIIHFKMTEPLVDYVPFVLDSLSDLADQLGGVPRQIQLRDVKLAGGLKEALEPSGIEIVVRESLPNLDNAVNGMMDFRGLGAKHKPGILDVKGMTLDHLIAFAEASKKFHEAHLWNHLSDDDLIAIEPSDGPPGTKFAQVLGAGGQTFGLGFTPSRDAHEKMRETGAIPRGGLWSILYDTIDCLPFEDGEAWERHDLPVADPRAYTIFLRRSRTGKYEYPSPQQLVWAEGLLRALAATTELEIDLGKWEKQVETLNGLVTYKLSLPLLLEQMGQEFQVGSSLSPVQEAEKLMELTREARGRREVQLARQALSLDPESVPALMLLGTLAGDPDRAVPFYERATEAAARQLGPQMFENAAGHFWLIVETRPYMRVRQMWAMELMNLGQYRQAASHWRDMLRLNPNDNQGIRYSLAKALLKAEMLDELDELLNRSHFTNDSSPEWTFTRVLLAFRRAGDTPEVRQRLLEAQRQNPHVIPFLTGGKRMAPAPPPTLSPGSEEEAMQCVIDIRDSWKDTPGAIDWLEQVAPKTRQKGAKNKGSTPKHRKKR